MSFEKITYPDGGHSGFLTLNRPNEGNMCSTDAGSRRKHRSTENTGERVHQWFPSERLRRLQMSCDIAGDEARKLAVALSERRAPDLTQLGR